MAEEKILTIPLRSEFQKAVYFKRSARAISAARMLIARHAKTVEELVKLGPYLNKEIFAHGRKNPPAYIKVKIWKDGDITRAESIAAPQETKQTPADKKKEKTVTLPKEEQQKEEQIEALEKEKKEVLAKGPEQPHEHHNEPERQYENKDLMQKEMTKKIYPKSQKPTHEKKK